MRPGITNMLERYNPQCARPSVAQGWRRRWARTATRQPFRRRRSSDAEAHADASGAPVGEGEPGEADQHHRPGRGFRHQQRVSRPREHVEGEVGGESVGRGRRVLSVPEQETVGIGANASWRLKISRKTGRGYVGEAEPRRVGDDLVNCREDWDVEDGQPLRLERLDFQRERHR